MFVDRLVLLRSAVIIFLGQGLEGLGDVVLANTVHGSMVNEKSDEVLTVDMRLVLSLFSQDREAYLISHVFNLHLGGVVSHSSH